MLLYSARETPKLMFGDGGAWEKSETAALNSIKKTGDLLPEPSLPYGKFREYLVKLRL